MDEDVVYIACPFKRCDNYGARYHGTREETKKVPCPLCGRPMKKTDPPSEEEMNPTPEEGTT